MKKDRILYIASFPPPVHGSAVVSQQIHDSRVINDVFEGDYINISTSRKTDELGKSSPIKYFRIIISYIKLFFYLIFKHYDLCYCAITVNGPCFIRDSVYVLMCKLFGRKVVIHQHNKGVSEYMRNPIYHRLYKLVYSNVKVILLSWYLYPDIEKYVKKNDVYVCPNGVAAPKHHISKREKENKITNMLFLSNLIESKGVLVLLDACQKLQSKGYAFKCDYVGGETQEISSERIDAEIKSRHLEGVVKYHGRKYGSEKDIFWKNADVFVFPTYYYNECFPLVLLEAMQNGLACVSTDEGGIRDIVEDNKTGLIVARQDAHSLTNAISYLIENPDVCISMGRDGRKKFEEEYTLEIFEKKMLGILMGISK